MLQILWIQIYVNILRKLRHESFRISLCSHMGHLTYIKWVFISKNQLKPLICRLKRGLVNTEDARVQQCTCSLNIPSQKWHYGLARCAGAKSVSRSFIYPVLSSHQFPSARQRLLCSISDDALTFSYSFDHKNILD